LVYGDKDYILLQDFAGEKP